MAHSLFRLAILCLSVCYAFPSSIPGLSAEDVFNLEYAEDPQISPDGTQVVYVRRWNDIQTDKTYTNLWIVGFDGSGQRPLTSGRSSDNSPRWSPDGKRLAYVSDQDGKAQIYVRWMDNGQTAAITSLESGPQGISWSPDGSQIAFVSLVKEPAPQIVKLPSPPQGAEWAEPAKVINRLRYRFNGAGYLPHGYNHIFVVPSEGGTPRQLTSGNYQHGGAGFRGSMPVWAPDGKHLLFSAVRRPDWEYVVSDTEVYEVAVADGTVRALTDRRGPDNSPAVSPDGQWIAYTGFDDRHQGHQTTRLYLMQRDGSGARMVSGDLDRDVGDPHWSADGSRLYFLYDDEGNTKMGSFRPDGGIQRALHEDLGSGPSSYSSGADFSLSKDGRMAFTRTTPYIPGDIAVAEAGGTDARRITDVNADLFAQRRLGKVEEIWYESSFDQRKMQGWIVRPLDFDPARRYPLVLEIHGGPFANYGDRFDYEKQVLAAKGYVVLYVNPRGSTSYGEAFANLIHHAYPGDDFYDLNSGVDFVIAQGSIDSDNLFVAGGSGGGVLTCWMIGRSNRFRAAVPYYPVINWYSWVLTADIPHVGVDYWFPGMPWDNVEHYEKRSLLSVVKNVRTPTMIITGEEDYRTPMSESEQYYQALKLLKVEAVLVRIPGEPHGTRRRPSHHMSRLMHIAAWFDQHRKESEEPSGQ